MNNEPIAWVAVESPGKVYYEAHRGDLPYRLYETARPLYEHPTRAPLTIQGIYDLLEAADPTETLQGDPHGTWEIVEFVRQIERHYGIQREGDLYSQWSEWSKL